MGPFTAEETVFQFVVPQIHRSAALDGCHHEAAHQGQRRSLSLMQERFWWPGMAHDLRNRIKKCGHCRKFEAASPVVANGFLLVFAMSGPFTSFLVLHTVSWFSRSEVCAFVWGIFVRGLRVETFVRVLRSSRVVL